MPCWVWVDLVLGCGEVFVYFVSELVAVVHGCGGGFDEYQAQSCREGEARDVCFCQFCTGVV